MGQGSADRLDLAQGRLASLALSLRGMSALAPGDCVRIERKPNGSPSSEAERVYAGCVGLKLHVLRVERDGRCAFDLGQMWHHFADVTPFELVFDADCLQKIEPFSDDEWAAITGWFERDEIVRGMVVEAANHLSVALPGGILAELYGDAFGGHDPKTYVGRPLPVRLVQINRKRRDLFAVPALPE